MAEIFYHAVPTDWRKEQKYRFLDDYENVSRIDWKEVKPDKRHNWLTAGMSEDFETFLPIASVDQEEAKEAIFARSSYGIQTNRDDWVINFNAEALQQNVTRLIDNYNKQRLRWATRSNKQMPIDEFLVYDDQKVKWSSRLKECVLRNMAVESDARRIRQCLYRPYVRALVHFDEVLIHRRSKFPEIFPTEETEVENRVVWLKLGGDWPIFALASRGFSDALPQGGSQAFPFYTYAEDGSGRRENITDWALQEFQTRYPASPATRHPPLTKWDIFHYVYAVLHHPEYRARYAANLRRELPRIPFVAADVRRLHSKPGAEEKEDGASSRRLLQDAEVFHAFAAADKRLAELHVSYEQQPEYPLERIEKPGEKLNGRVEKMKLIKTGAAPLTRSSTTLSPSDGERDGVRGTLAIRYNDFLSLAGIPAEVLDYRLGNRSALEWVIDQYQVSTDKRSGITNDPNRPDDPEYIVRLLGQVITVSLETVKVVKGLPALENRAQPAP